MLQIVRPLLWGALFTLLSALTVSAQVTNPNISVIGDTRSEWSDQADRTTLDFHELEVAFVGPVNPYATAEAYIGIHGVDGFEIEEAKLLLDRYLPGGFGLTIGRYLQDFGQLNQIHLHAYPFVMRPMVYVEMFGDDGVIDTGVRLDWIAPFEAVTVRATAGAIRGESLLGGQAHGHAADAADEPAEPVIGMSGRVDMFAEPTRDLSLLVGASLLHGDHDPAEGAAATWIGFDAKVRWEFGPVTTLVTNAEMVLGSLDATTEHAQSDPSGWFVSADLRANKRWNFGGFVESKTERVDDALRTNRAGGFAGFALMEESTLFRFVGYTTDPDDDQRDTGVLLQALFSLGPHRPHRY